MKTTTTRKQPTRRNLELFNSVLRVAGLRAATQWAELAIGKGGK